MTAEERPSALAGAAPSGAGGALYVVATPIGNLGDITLRALEVLRTVPLVAAEDTRLTRRLWARHGIGTRLISYHARSEARRRDELLAHLAAGEDLALVTDAGTPLVSDPGGELVAEWSRRGGRIVPIPGASAVLAGLVSSALPASRWAFEGFLPRRGRERRERIARICGDDRATVLFEAPGRVAGTLADLLAACGADRPAAVCRELTKLHEEVWRGSLAELARRAGEGAPRGEVTIVIAGAGAGDDHDAAQGRVQGGSVDLDTGRRQVDELVTAGWSRSSAAREVAQRTGLVRRELFKG